MLSDCFQTVRTAIDDALTTAGLAKANERSIKKSDYTTKWIISDGSGTVERGSTCANLYEWYPVITIFLHNGGDRPEMHKEASRAKLIAIDAIQSLDNTNIEGIVGIGTPMSWEELEITDNTAELRLTVTAQSYRGIK